MRRVLAAAVVALSVMPARADALWLDDQRVHRVRAQRRRAGALTQSGPRYRQGCRHFGRRSSGDSGLYRTFHQHGCQALAAAQKALHVPEST
jgi:hypothetical protein